MPHPWGLPQSREPPVLPSSSWSIPLVFQAQSELSVRLEIGQNQVDTRNSLEEQVLICTAEEWPAKAVRNTAVSQLGQLRPVLQYEQAAHTLANKGVLLCQESINGQPLALPSEASLYQLGGHSGQAKWEVLQSSTGKQRGGAPWRALAVPRKATLFLCSAGDGFQNLTSDHSFVGILFQVIVDSPVVTHVMLTAVTLMFPKRTESWE